MLFDHLVGAGEQGRRKIEAERRRCRKRRQRKEMVAIIAGILLDP
jgi:hypothetical protein